MGPGTGIAPGSARTGLLRRPYEPFSDHTVALGVPTASGTPDPLRREAATPGCRTGNPDRRGAPSTCPMGTHAEEPPLRGSSRPERVISHVECINNPNGPIPWVFERCAQRGTTPSIDEETGERVRRGIELLGNDRSRDAARADHPWLRVEERRSAIRRPDN